MPEKQVAGGQRDKRTGERNVGREMEPAEGGDPLTRQSGTNNKAKRPRGMPPSGWREPWREGGAARQAKDMKAEDAMHAAGQAIGQARQAKRRKTRRGG